MFQDYLFVLFCENFNSMLYYYKMIHLVGKSGVLGFWGLTEAGIFSDVLRASEVIIDLIIFKLNV